MKHNQRTVEQFFFLIFILLCSCLKNSSLQCSPLFFVYFYHCHTAECLLLLILWTLQNKPQIWNYFDYMIFYFYPQLYLLPVCLFSFYLCIPLSCIFSVFFVSSPSNHQFSLYFFYIFLWFKDKVECSFCSIDGGFFFCVFLLKFNLSLFFGWKFFVENSLKNTKKISFHAYMSVIQFSHTMK